MGIDVETSGFDNLSNQFREALSDAMDELADDIYDTTTNMAPVDTGNLLHSISVNKTSDFSIQAHAAADYASFVDEGTTKMDAQPFFEEPINDIVGDFASKIEDKLSGLFG
jgi:HK97 gp10 family phage protein